MYHPTLRTALRRHGIALFAALSLHGAYAAASEPQFQAAFQQMQLALKGDNDAIDRAADQFAALVQAEPADPVLMAYAGASTTLKAKAALLPWRKMGYAEDGLAQIDKALALLQPQHDQPLHHNTPASLETRFTAASTFLGLPDMFHRSARGAQLLNEVLQSPLLGKAPLPFQGSVWMRAGAQAAKEKRIDDAKRWFNEVVQHNAPQAEAARAQLKELQS